MVGTLGAIGAGALGGASINIIINAIDNFTSVFKDVNKGMLALGVGITAIGVAGAGAIGGLTKLAGEFEQTQIAFATMLGSAELGNKVLEDLAEFASRTPFTITGIEQNAKQLLAMGIETKDLLPTLKSLGDVSAGLNVPLERLALNFGQVKVQGRLTGRELRDFSVAGVPLIAELAKNLNVAEKEVKEMVTAGEIGFKEVDEAFTSMTSSGGKFFDLMDAQSKTFLGQMSNIQDNFIRIGRVMGTVFLPAAKAAAESLAVLTGWFEQHPTVSKWVAIALFAGTALALIVGPLLILIALLPAFTGGLAIASTSLGGFSLAALGANAAMIGPLGLIALLTAAAGILLWEHAASLARTAEAYDTMGGAIDRNIGKFEDMNQTLTDLEKRQNFGQFPTGTRQTEFVQNTPTTFISPTTGDVFTGGTPQNITVNIDNIFGLDEVGVAVNMQEALDGIILT